MPPLLLPLLLLLAGRALVGLGVGLASAAVPVFIAEAAPAARRATLVTLNVFAITGGQFVAYVTDYAFSHVPGTWRWMLGVAALPALLQIAGLLLLPESPRWLAARGHAAAAQRALSALQPGAVLPQEWLPLPPQQDDRDNGASEAARLLQQPGGGGTWRLLRTPAVLRELHVGVGLQVLQQVAGINTVM